jgi:hypothetical protein
MTGYRGAWSDRCAQWVELDPVEAVCPYCREGFGR